jgi:hypothetical protein
MAYVQLLHSLATENLLRILPIVQSSTEQFPTDGRQYSLDLQQHAIFKQNRKLKSKYFKMIPNYRQAFGLPSGSLSTVSQPTCCLLIDRRDSSIKSPELNNDKRERVFTPL